MSKEQTKAPAGSLNAFSELVAFFSSIGTVPPLLFHYTDQVGFEGILRTRTLRATHIQYLNDSAEYAWAANVAKRVIATRRPSLDETGQQVMTAFERDLTNLSKRASVHVTSLSEHRDQLSQWRAYCPAGSGYSMGFRGEALHERFRPNNTFLVRCVYSHDEQERLINNLIDNALDLRARSQHNPKRIVTSLFATFSFIASLLKHPKFREEREWRLLAYPYSDALRGLMKFRPGRSMLIPFVDVPFAQADGDDSGLLAEVVVGPTPHKRLSSWSAQMACEQFRFRDVTVRASKIPFRSW